MRVVPKDEQKSCYLFCMYSQDGDDSVARVLLANAFLKGTTTPAEGRENLLEDKVLQLSRHNRWLKDEVSDAEAALRRMEMTSSEKQDDASITDEEFQRQESELQEEILQLQEKTYQLSSQVGRQQLLLKRIQQHGVASSALFDQSEDSAEADSFLINLMHHRDARVTQFLELHEERNQLTHELSQLEQRNADRNQENREHWSQLTRHLEKGNLKLDDTMQTPQITKLTDQIKAAVDKNTVLRQTLLALIIESGVSWADDERLKSLVLTLDDSPFDDL
eukprot:GILJ01007707.1.p1 GENE.GILJ01007707.1~~GILJ01007707.1.p1  ORF type:complete len:278 (-),score=54.67 GILJ01007707.1:391-1224(-)